MPAGTKRTLEQSAITDDDGGFVIHCSQTYTRDTPQVEAGSPGVRLTPLTWVMLCVTYLPKLTASGYACLQMQAIAFFAPADAWHSGNNCRQHGLLMHKCRLTPSA